MNIEYVFHDYNYYEIKYIFEENNKKSFDYEYIDINNGISLINEVNLT